MVLSWAIYALMISLAAGWAAAMADRLFRLFDRQARGVWLGAMVASVGVPLATVLVPRGGGGAGAPPPDWMPPVVPEVIGSLQGAGAAAPPLLAWLEASFVWIWVGLSLLVAAWLARSVFRVRAQQASWEPLDDDGCLYRGEEVGPAAVGFARPRVVLPEWVLKLTPGQRRIVLLHEQEHARSRDPAVVMVGWSVVAAAPWLLPLWWQLRRLRQAVEQDCDLRVVRRTGDPRAYGRVLLEASRRGQHGVMPLLTGGESFLGDRIRSLVQGRPRHRAARAAAAALALAMGVAAAALVPPPTRAAAFREADAAAAPAGVSPEVWRQAHRSSGHLTLVNGAEMEEAVRAAHPPELRRSGIGGVVFVLARVRPGGTVDATQVVKSSGHPALDRAALEVAPRLRYRAEPTVPIPERGLWGVQPIRFPAD